MDVFTVTTGNRDGIDNDVSFVAARRELAFGNRRTEGGVAYRIFGIWFKERWRSSSLGSLS
jgi:hypothetical protein